MAAREESGCTFAEEECRGGRGGGANALPLSASRVYGGGGGGDAMLSAVNAASCLNCHGACRMEWLRDEACGSLLELGGGQTSMLSNDVGRRDGCWGAKGGKSDHDDRLRVHLGYSIDTSSPPVAVLMPVLIAQQRQQQQHASCLGCPAICYGDALPLLGPERRMLWPTPRSVPD